MIQLIRNCPNPNCNKIITYKSKYHCRNATNKGSLCKICSSIGRNLGKKHSYETRAKYSESRKGAGNSFFGKHHSLKTIEKLRNVDRSYTQTEEFKRNQKIPINTKSFYQCWIEKYGKEEADRRLILFKEKQRANNSGEKNNQFGKPAPQGSGNGWSGWYKGWYFRSLLELSYMIKVIERFNLTWESADNQKFKIPYEFYDGTHNYFPDFLINGKFLVEIKPKRLWNTPRVLAKKEAAIKFCNDNNLTYKLVKCKPMACLKLKKLIDCGIVKLLDKYIEKFENYGKETNAYGGNSGVWQKH